MIVVLDIYNNELQTFIVFITLVERVGYTKLNEGERCPSVRTYGLVIRKKHVTTMLIE